MATINRSDFYTIVSCISRCAANWSHEGVVLSLARGKGNEEMSAGSRERFCEEIRGFLRDIEEPPRPISKPHWSDERDADTANPTPAFLPQDSQRDTDA